MVDVDRRHQVSDVRRIERSPEQPDPGGCAVVELRGLDSGHEGQPYENNGPTNGFTDTCNLPVGGLTRLLLSTVPQITPDSVSHGLSPGSLRPSARVARITHPQAASRGESTILPLAGCVPHGTGETGIPNTTNGCTKHHE